MNRAIVNRALLALKEIGAAESEGGQIHGAVIPTDSPKSIAEMIPDGALLRAPRYDGYGASLDVIPNCWCCRLPWELEHIQDQDFAIVAWLKPGCRCLDVPQAVACCGRCVGHCQCRIQIHD